MTLDGIFDHTAGLPDEAVHNHYTELLGQGEAILYGRTTYTLMEYWRTFLKEPSEEKSMNDFAWAIYKIPKIVFSRTLQKLDWDTATLAENELEVEVKRLKEQAGRDIFVGSRSLIIQLLELRLLDEFQLCIYPVVAGEGRRLFEGLQQRILFQLERTKSFPGGAVILYYRPVYD